MNTINIKKTQNERIIKFEFEDFITYGKNHEFKNIDEAENSPLAQELFYLPFVKTVYISGNFIAIERYNIVEWEEVQEEVKQKIIQFLDKGGKILVEDKTPANKKIPVTVYTESTPNPAVMKYVCNKPITKTALEYKNIDEATTSPLAQELFKFPFVKEVFLDMNYISITKYNQFQWEEFAMELRSFIKEYIENGGIIIKEKLVQETKEHAQTEQTYFTSLDDFSQKIVSILEEYVKPAVQADGGNITFENYDADNQKVTVTLKGACSGCPSSTFTLKNGIETMLKDMLNAPQLTVEAHNG